MNNRNFWVLCVGVSALVTALCFTGAGPSVQSPAGLARVSTVADQTPHTQERGPTYAHVIADHDVPAVPGAPLEFYLEQFNPIPAEQRGGVAACFAEGTPWSVIEFVENEIYGGGQRYILNTRWSGAQGSRRALTWSFIPDGVVISGGVGEPAAGSTLFATLDAAYAAQGGRATWVLRFQQCFDRWAQLAGLTYTRVTVGGNDWDDGAAWGSVGAVGLRGDVRIGAHPIDGASNILAYNYFPSNGDMVLDSNDSGNWASASNLNRFLRNVAAHEHGHGMGLSHVCPYTDNANKKLMEPFISTGYDGPRHDDTRASQRHYGDPFEDNNTAAQAPGIGTVEAGSPIHSGDVPLPPTGTNQTYSALLSIDADSEQDWWRFHVNGARSATVTITPFGTSYASYAQDASCNNNTVTINSLTIADLNVSIIDTNGVTILGDSAVQPAGIAETLSGVCLPAAGDYYVKVYEGNAPSQTQSYKIDLSATCPTVSVSPIANDSTVCGLPYSSAAPSASSSCGSSFTWSLGGTPPAGMTIDPNTGIVSWPNPLTSPTPYNITVEASNGCGNGSQTLVLSVLVGDFNGDGVLDDLDIPALVDHVLGLDTSRTCAADVNGDTFIDGVDIGAWTDLAL